MPEHPAGIVHFARLFRNKLPPSPLNKPTIVHCSAGVGRSGTFIALDRLVQNIECGKPIDVFGTVHEMRMERCHMVQNEVSLRTINYLSFPKFSNNTFSSTNRCNLCLKISSHSSFLHHPTNNHLPANKIIPPLDRRPAIVGICLLGPQYLRQLVAFIIRQKKVPEAPIPNNL